MKRIFALASLILVTTACGPDEGAGPSAGLSVVGGPGGSGAAGVGGQPGAFTPPKFAAADGGPVHGTFRVINSDGETSVDTVLEDGRFSTSYEDGTVQTGRWQQRAQGVFCVLMDYEEAEQACFHERVNQDGVWVSYDPDTQSVARIERIQPIEQ